MFVMASRQPGNRAMVTLFFGCFSAKFACTGGLAIQPAVLQSCKTDWCRFNELAVVARCWLFPADW